MLMSFILIVSMISNKSQHEMCEGRIHLVRRLKVFGSTYYALIPKEQRNKLGAKSRNCIFLGCSITTKACHLYYKVNKKFILSRHVIFLEMNKNDNM